MALPLEQASTQLNEAKNDWRDSNTRLDQEKTRLDQANTRLDQAKNDLREATTFLTNIVVAKENIKQLEDSRTFLNQKRNAIQKAKDELQTELVKAKGYIIGHGGVINDNGPLLQQVETLLPASIESLKKAIEQQEKLVEQQEKNVQQQNRAVLDLQAQVTILMETAENIRQGLLPVPTMNAATFLQTPLYDHPIGANVKRTSESVESSMAKWFVPKFEKWDDFNPQTLTQYLANRVVRLRNREPDPAFRFTHEVGFGNAWNNPRADIREMMMEAFPQLGLDHVEFPTNVLGGRGGVTDECMVRPTADVKNPEILFIMEEKRPTTTFDESMQPGESLQAFVDGNRGDHGVKLDRLNLFLTTLELYNYLRSKQGNKYGFISNWKQGWVFFKRRVNDQGEEILDVSPMYNRLTARCAYAYFLKIVMEDPERTIVPGRNPDLIMDIQAFNSGERRIIQQGATGGGSSASPTTTTTTSGGGGINRRSMGAELDGIICQDVPIQDSIDSQFGQDGPLAFRSDSTLLDTSDKSATYRATLNGQDLVWKLVDFRGIKNVGGFTWRGAFTMMENEVKTYHYLGCRGVQGKLIPRFIQRGPDVGYFWVTMTSYEGVSLEVLVERDGGLDLSTMMRARESLRALHALGVLHNDVELRNVVKREGSDDAVLWVDFELARIRKPEDDAGWFESQAQQEMARLEDLFKDVVVLVDKSSRNTLIGGGGGAAAAIPLSPQSSLMSSSLATRPLKMIKIVPSGGCCGGNGCC
jgi:hypothetical protein